MTRDEQIAQLKPGDTVEVLATTTADYFKAFVLSLPTLQGWLVVAREPWTTSVTVSAVAVHVSRLRFPEPPPKPKAVPGVRYTSKCGSGNVQRMGTHDGRLWNPELYLPTVDLDWSWTPIDPVEEGK